MTLTGLRNPCRQIDVFRPGLLRLLARQDPAGAVELLAGVMGVVSRGGVVSAGTDIDVALPPEPHLPLTWV